MYPALVSDILQIHKMTFCVLTLAFDISFFPYLVVVFCTITNLCFFHLGYDI